MKPPSDHHELFPPAVGEPADLCERLHADLNHVTDAAILHVLGYADAYTRPRWQRILDTAIGEAADSGHLVVDLSAAQFIGCGPILDLAERAQQSLARGVQVSVFNPFPNVVDRVIALAGLTAWLTVHTTLTRALATRRPRAAAPTSVVVPVPGAR
ncbi:STAS domain-containing protein [Nocardia sp. NPDC058379]|uniref:STAS domain-containing protein n=1 Tax=unclassified Nocardia TaxID=2637762 RepID=UPI0036606D44